MAGVDSIANHAKLWADKTLQARSHPDNAVSATLPTGEGIERRVHPDYLGHDVKLVDKCIDFEAYKQCPVAPAHSRYGIFALKNPASHQAEFFIVRSLPFGATASVHGFNRPVHAVL